MFVFFNILWPKFSVLFINAINSDGYESHVFLYLQIKFWKNTTQYLFDQIDYNDSNKRFPVDVTINYSIQ